MYLNIGRQMKNDCICIVEDEDDIVEALSVFLKASDYIVSSYSSAEQFYEEKDPDFRGLYLVDWNLPGEPGLNIVSKIREEDKFSPIFMMSAYNKKEDIMEGLKRGADDYITKPFNLDELLLRINNAQRKFNEVCKETNFEGIKLLPEAAAFIKNKQTINLTTREYIIFEKLHIETGKPISREMLIECFKNDDKMTVRNIDVHIFSLRKKIKQAELLIETVWGMGYKLI
jgi:DNA-binding response OmpR family regulator